MKLHYCIYNIHHFSSFVYNDTECIIQTSHVTDKDLLPLNGFCGSVPFYDVAKIR
jgi:hypothetical protein